MVKKKEKKKREPLSPHTNYPCQTKARETRQKLLP